MPAQGVVGDPYSAPGSPSRRRRRPPTPAPSYPTADLGSSQYGPSPTYPAHTTVVTSGNQAPVVTRAGRVALPPALQPTLPEFLTQDPGYLATAAELRARYLGGPNPDPAAARGVQAQAAYLKRTEAKDAQAAFEAALGGQAAAHAPPLAQIGADLWQNLRQVSGLPKGPPRVGIDPSLPSDLNAYTTTDYVHGKPAKGASPQVLISPETARRLYNRDNKNLQDKGLRVLTHEFGHAGQQEFGGPVPNAIDKASSTEGSAERFAQLALHRLGIPYHGAGTTRPSTVGERKQLAADVPNADVLYGQFGALTPGQEHLAGRLRKAAGQSGQIDLNSIPDMGEARRWAPFVAKQAEAHGLPPSVLMAQIEQESGFQRGLTSSAGAQGMTQFIPSTAAQYGVRFGTSDADVRSQIKGQAKLMADNVASYGNLNTALGAYLGDPDGGQGGPEYASSIMGNASKYAALDSAAQRAPIPDALKARALDVLGKRTTRSTIQDARNSPTIPPDAPVTVKFAGKDVPISGPYSGSRAMVRLITGSPGLRGDHGGTPFGEPAGLHEANGDHYRPDGYAQDINGDNPRENEPPFTQATMDTVVKNLRALGADVPDLTIGGAGWSGTVQGYDVFIEGGITNHIHVGAHPAGAEAPGSVSVSDSGITTPGTSTTGGAIDTTTAATAGAAAAGAGAPAPGQSAAMPSFSPPVASSFSARAPLPGEYQGAGAQQDLTSLLSGSSDPSELATHIEAFRPQRRL